MDVTLDAAPTTPEMTLFPPSGDEPSLHLEMVSSPMLLIEPKIKHLNKFINGQKNEEDLRNISDNLFQLNLSPQSILQIL